MAYKPTDWLGPLIEDDIQAAVTWYKRTGAQANIKKDPGLRFEDDGSNLKCELGSPPLSDNSTVQVVKWLSTEDPLLILSDGFTSLRAWLSTEVMAALQAEIDEPIDLETDGDVFTIRKCTIVSTPYGPTEGHVQVIIKEIKYNYHLRKIAGVPVPIGDRPGVSRLMSEVMLLRNPETVEESINLPDNTANGSKSQRKQSDRFETQAVPHSPASQPDVNLASSPVATAPRSSPTQPAIATQLTGRHRKAAPKMARDGIEMVAGVNLDRPTAAVPSRFTQNRSLPAQSKPAAMADSNAHLLSVLGKRKSPSEAQAPTATPRDKIAGSSNPTQSASPLVAAQGSGGLQASTRPSKPGIESARVNQAISRAQASQNSSGRPSPKPSWQRKIPKDQRKLLDSPASWLPPLPGRDFPHPNVPIELLKRWNHEAHSKPESVVLSQSLPSRSQDRSNSQQVVGGTKVDKEDSSEGGDSESESDVPWSSSPPRPALLSERAAVPMNSPAPGWQARATGTQQSSSLSSSPPEELPSQTSPSSSRPSTAERRSERPPDSSFEHPIAPRALGQQQAREAHKASRAAKGAHTPTRVTEGRTSVSQQASPHRAVKSGDGQMARTQPDQLQSPKGIFAPRAQSQLSPIDRQGTITTPGSYQYRPERREKPKAWVEIQSPQRQRMTQVSSPSERTPVQATAKVTETSPEVQLLHVRQSPLQSRTPQNAPPSTAATVVKGTQISGNDSDDDVMEIDPPSRVDPTLEHQKRRSEYLRHEQRRRWIKANYTPNPKKPFNLGTLYSGYRKAYPKDELRPSQLAEAYEDVYPNAANASKNSTAPVKADENVASTVQRPRASLADLDAADATPSTAPNEPGPQWRRGWELEQGSPAVSSASREKDTRSTFAVHACTGATDEHAVNPAIASAVRKLEEWRKPKAIAGDGTDEAGATPKKNLSRNAVAKQPAAGDIRKASTVVAQAAVRSTNQSPAGSATSASATSKAKVALDHRSWLIKRIESDQMRLRNEMLDSRRKGAGEGGGAFKEFAGAWREIRPGGAFAEKKGEGAGPKRQRVRLGVLGWEL